jgi:hypothetical protein
VIRLDRKNACRRREVARRNARDTDQRSRSAIGSHAHIFEDECADQEVVEVREWIERRSNARSRSQRIEGICQIEVRSRNRRGTEGRTQKANMSLFVIGNLVEDILLSGGKPGQLRSANDRTRSCACIRGGQARSGCCTEIKFRLQILKVEREIQNIHVVIGRGGRSRRSVRRRSTASRKCGRCSCCADARKKLAPIKSPLVRKFTQYIHDLVPLLDCFCISTCLGGTMLPSQVDCNETRYFFIGELQNSIHKPERDTQRTPNMLSASKWRLLVQQTSGLGAWTTHAFLQAVVTSRPSSPLP